MKLRKLYCFVIIVLIILFKNYFTISTQRKKSNNYRYLVNKVLTDTEFDLWGGIDKSNDVIPFHSGLKFEKSAILWVKSF